MGGTKHDGGKERWHLLPWRALREVAKVMTMGAMKYGEYNWKEGIKSSRYFDALMRHNVSRLLGETTDPESKLDHLAHVAANALMDLETYIEKEGRFDDRRLPSKPKLEALHARIDPFRIRKNPADTGNEPA